LNYTTKGFKLPEGSEFYELDHANFNAQKSNDLIVELENSRPKKTLDNISYYVDAVNGSDANDGLTQATAFQHIYKAIGMLPQVINNDVAIYVYGGTYNEIVSLKGIVGGGKVTLQSMNGPIITQVLWVTNCTVEVSIAGITVNSAGYLSECVLIKNCTSVSLSNTTINGVNVTHPSAVGILCYKAQVGLLNCTISNMTNCGVFAHMNSFVSSQSCSGVGNAVGLKASDGIIFKLGTQPSGTTAQETFNAGQIFSQDVEERINSLDANKANKVQEDWITATLQNGWTTVDMYTAKYMKDEFGFVHLKGEVKDGALATTILTLPPGYRPEEGAFSIGIFCKSGTSKMLTDVNIYADTGELKIWTGGTTQVILNGITFKAGA
jgi:hypothetical protein